MHLSCRVNTQFEHRFFAADLCKIKARLPKKPGFQENLVVVTVMDSDGQVKKHIGPPCHHLIQVDDRFDQLCLTLQAEAKLEANGPHAAIL